MRTQPRHSCLVFLLGFASFFSCTRADNSAASSNKLADSLAQHADASSASCSQPLQGPIQVTEDSLGSASLWSSLSALRALYRCARDTVRYGEESVYPAVVFSFNGLRALASQYGDSLNPSQPADTWIIQGRDAVLPRGVPLTATWTDLRRRYGDARGETGDEPTVMFCSFPRVFFVLDTPLEDVGPITDFSTIPATARIKRVNILDIRPAGWHC